MICPPSAVWMLLQNGAVMGIEVRAECFRRGTANARIRRRRSKKSIPRRERMIEDMRKVGVPEEQSQLAP